MSKTKGDTPPLKADAKRGPDGRFGPGNTANPNGRPRKEFCLTEMARTKLYELTEDGRTKLQVVVDRWIELAMAGDVHARNALLDRIEGKVALPLSGPEGGAIVIEHLTESELDAEIRGLLAELGDEAATSPAPAREKAHR